MTRDEILDRMVADAALLPARLRDMVVKYCDAVKEGTHSPARLMRHGATLLNQTFMRAEGGDVETQQSMVRSGVNAIALAHAAELFAGVALKFEEGKVDASHS